MNPCDGLRDALHAGLCSVLVKVERFGRQPGTRLVGLSPRGPGPYDEELFTRRVMEFLSALATEPGAGAFILPEVDRHGRLHGHGIAMTARPVGDLNQDWAARTGSLPAYGLHARVMRGSSDTWRPGENVLLLASLHGWLRYATKPVPPGFALHAGARVVVSGTLAPVWGAVLLSPGLWAGSPGSGH